MQGYDGQHRFLPPATPNAHADVETVHSWMEPELFDLERFSSRDDFLAQLRTYQRWWNFARLNYSKGGKTPTQILDEQGFNPVLLLLPPVGLDQLFRYTTTSPRVGQDLYLPCPRDLSLDHSLRFTGVLAHRRWRIARRVCRAGCAGRLRPRLPCAPEALRDRSSPWP